MNDPTNPTSVTLGREPAFHVGALEIRPATREVVGAGWRDVLEPRVMQVMVVLARAGGEVVARDDLITACWEGRVVGDDALNRVIAKIRRIAERPQSGITLETIRKVGYRLAPAEPVAAPEAPAAADVTTTTPPTQPEPAATRRPRFRVRWIGFAAAAVTLVLSAWVAFAAVTPPLHTHTVIALQSARSGVTLIHSLRNGANSSGAAPAFASYGVGFHPAALPYGRPPGGLAAGDAARTPVAGIGSAASPMSFLPSD